MQRPAPSDSGPPERDQTFASIKNLTKAYLAKKLSPLEVVRDCLNRISRYDPPLCSIITVAADQALAAAAVAEKAYLSGQPVGPLHGVPIVAKDTEATAGIRTTFGSDAYETFVPKQDSIVIQRLKAAGAIVIAKTNVPELGMGAESKSTAGGYSLNPWNRSRTSGGSSGGSAAAVAAGFATAATGSDAAGSILTPAAFCGVFGVKPTRGRVPHWPPPNTWPSFLEAGSMARNVADATLLLDVMAGPDPRDTHSSLVSNSRLECQHAQTLAGLKAAWTLNMGYGHVGVEAASAGQKALQALAQIGLIVEEAHPDVTSPFETWSTIARVEEFAAWNVLLHTHRHKLSPQMQERLEAGQAVSLQDYVAAQNARLAFKDAFDRFFRRFDFLIAPTNAVGAFRPGAPPGIINGAPVKPDWEGFTPFPICANLTGYPAATIPSGFTEDGMPLGLMIIARPEEESRLLSLCAALEEASPWPGLAPVEDTQT
jgi:Asp-tRNA(Asn)/Glu-tRNA(Gln) amidotransferase A subunit family amidase